MDRCAWHGYGFGASYYDAACCDGEIGDLDDVIDADHIGLREEVCPNCGGSGKADTTLGDMALIRQRFLDSCISDCAIIEDQDLREEIEAHFKAWHSLVTKLENPNVKQG